MKPISKISLVVFAWMVAATAFAQHESTLHFMNSLPQVSYNNPAFKPQYKFSLGLPGSSIYVQYANNGFAYYDFAKEQGDSTVIDLNKLYQSARSKNYITTAAQADIFRFSMKASARMYFTFNITAKTYNRQLIPKELLDVFINGTEVLDKSTSIAPQVESLAYLEGAWGASYVINKDLTIGARFKLLKGLVNATTKSSQFNLVVDEGYVTATANADIRTSGINQWNDDNFDFEDDWNVYKKNTGFAIDLGSTYQVNDKLLLGLSLIDIGAITWKNDPYGYKLDPQKNRATFKAVDLQDVINGDETTLDDATDELDANFEFEEGAIGAYRSPIPAKMYLSGSYALKKSLTAGVLLFAEKFQGRFSPGVSASINKNFGRRLSTSLSYTVTNNSFNNIGAGLSLNFAPIQFYIVGDNILRAPIALLKDGDIEPYLYNSQFVNVRAGLNFVFGWDKKQEKLPTPGR